MSAVLPQPSATQMTRSAELLSHIRHLISQHNGWLPFDAYMNAVLYTPHLGYYSNEGSPFSSFGDQGDFITAPLLSHLFGACLAEQAIEIFKRTQSTKILEIGAGTGRLASNILTHLTQSGIAADYYILELSSTLRSEQQTTLAESGQKATWLDTLPNEFDGLIIGNEVLDAIPVELIGIKDGIWFERGLTWQNNCLAYEDQPTIKRLPMSEHWQQSLQSSGGHYISETHLQQVAFMNSLANSLRCGVILMIDYGFPAHEFYHPQRNTGTLMCHIQHIAHDNALYYPGVQDITAHVNFSALLDIERLTTLGYANQANFLINTGLLNLLASIDHSEQRIQANRVHKLLSEAEMGELFKVMAWGKNLNMDDNDVLIGFERGDRLASL